MEARVARTLDQVIARLPKSEREQIEARAQELIAEELSLRSLRKAIGKTQTAVARRLKVGQDAVSKIETRSDMRVSTLRDFVKAMGGELKLLAQFPGRPPVRLEALGTVSRRSHPRTARISRRASSSAARSRRQD
jgi:DNA-binding XRE family transcriptional regulator